MIGREKPFPCAGLSSGSGGYCVSVSQRSKGEAYPAFVWRSGQPVILRLNDHINCGKYWRSAEWDADCQST